MNQNETLRAALQALLDMYLAGANSGDWGNWDVESEPQVIAARAALAQPAAPVVERADSATSVVERGAGNVSDNAAPVAHAEPASEPAPAPRLRWAEAPRRTEWGAGMMEALIALGVDETLRLYAHRDDVPMVDALLPAQPAPALVPLTDEQAESLIENSDGRWHDGEFRIDGPDLMKLLRDAAQPAPARVPLTGAEIASMQPEATTLGTLKCLLDTPPTSKTASTSRHTP